MGRFQRSWRLVQASAAVLRGDPTLTIYPVVSGVAVVLVLAILAAPAWALGLFSDLGDGGLRPVHYVALFIAYFVAYVIIIFCNAALIGSALQRLDGVAGPVSGWQLARQRLPMIVGYAAISATVGVLLQIIRDRSEVAGRIVAGLAGAAWSIATFLAVPTLVAEGVGPIEAVKSSTVRLRRTWGEQLIGSGGIGLVSGLAILAVVLVGGGLIALMAATGVTALVVVAVAIVAALVVVVAVISSALDGIYRAAVYRYATGHETAAYPTDLVETAFTVR